MLESKIKDFFKHNFAPENLDLKSQRALVIVEPRIHKELPFVIHNFVYFSKGWSLYIFHSNENKKYIDTIIDDSFCNKIEICSGNLNIKDYNLLLTSKWFYDKIDAEYILIFQCDTFIRKVLDNSFFDYDYIGAPWKHIKKAHGGNGGLSLRKKSVMLEIINTKSYTDFPYTPTFSEDGYFSSYLQILRKKVPEPSIAKTFSVETVYYEDPFGVHAYWKYLQDTPAITIDLENI